MSLHDWPCLDELNHLHQGFKWICLHPLANSTEKGWRQTAVHFHRWVGFPTSSMTHLDAYCHIAFADWLGCHYSYRHSYKLNTITNQLDIVYLHIAISIVFGSAHVLVLEMGWHTHHWIELISSRSPLVLDHVRLFENRFPSIRLSLNVSLQVWVHTVYTLRVELHVVHAWTTSKLMWLGKNLALNSCSSHHFEAIILLREKLTCSLTSRSAHSLLELLLLEFSLLIHHARVGVVTLSA